MTPNRASNPCFVTYASVIIATVALTLPVHLAAQGISYQEINGSFGFLRNTEGSGNTLIFRGRDGTVLVDTMDDSVRSDWTAALSARGIDDVRYVFNTHWHQNHVGGNAAMSSRAAIMAPTRLRERLQEDQHLSFLVNQVFPAMSPAHWPNITFDDSIAVNVNGERVVAWHVRGHTDTDAIVHFTGSDIVATGDLWSPGGLIMSDMDTGGDVYGVRRALRDVLERVGPDVRIMPGHGPIGTRSDLEAYVAGLDALLEFVSDARARGLGLREIQALEVPEAVTAFARNATSRMIEAAYRSPSAPSR